MAGLPGWFGLETRAGPAQSRRARFYARL